MFKIAQEYITKDMATAPFRKGERRYGMSKGLREAWPVLKSGIADPVKPRYDFVYRLDNRNLLRKAMQELQERKK